MLTCMQDGDSTVLSEPSHMHSTDDLSYERGVEYRLMAAARRRNPDIKLYALQWTAPSWVAAGGRSLLTTQNINYTLSWLHGARARWNISTMDYLGFWNEQAVSNGPRDGSSRCMLWSCCEERRISLTLHAFLLSTVLSLLVWFVLGTKLVVYSGTTRRTEHERLAAHQAGPP